MGNPCWWLSGSGCAYWGPQRLTLGLAQNRRPAMLVGWSFKGPSRDFHLGRQSKQGLGLVRQRWGRKGQCSFYTSVSTDGPYSYRVLVPQMWPVTESLLL